MNIIYITYWGINDGLSQSTVWPHLSFLSENEKVSSIFVFSFERGTIKNFQFPKVTHFPITEKNQPFGLNKFLSFRSAIGEINKLIENIKVDLVICRSSFSGILGQYIFKKYNIPFIVESFEPHTEYMEESGEWKKGGFKSKILLHYEKKILKNAKHLYPVSQNYKNRLISQGIDSSKIVVMPCSVPINTFAFNPENRECIRSGFNIPKNGLTGIYVGKFGGIYLDNEAIDLFKTFFEVLENFYLIILTPQEADLLYNKFQKSSLPVEKILIKKVLHSEVPDYLSAADFAFSLQKFMPSNAFLNPIKIGEYWANGLPILITKGVGDDDAIISENEIGVVYDVATENPKSASKRMVDFMLRFDRNNENQRKKIVGIAKKYRSFEINNTIYSDLLNSIDKNGQP